MLRVQQLCRQIAAHPSKINQINQAIEWAVNEKHMDSFKPILDLLQGILRQSNPPQLTAFIEKKVAVVFQSIVEASLQTEDPSSWQHLHRSYSLSSNQDSLLEQFVRLISEDEAGLSLTWPLLLLRDMLVYLTQRHKSQDKGDDAILLRIVIEMPQMSEWQTAEQSQKTTFQKAFQSFLLALLARPGTSRQHLLAVYHNLGNRVLSKMHQPLALSNHCIARFANDPELQIELLACLFILVGKYGLELDQFYPKLQLLARSRKQGNSIYGLSNSKRFFKLLEAALKSSRVPFYTIRSFSRMLVQQLPDEDAQFAFWALSLIINLTKKHRKLLQELPSMPQMKLLRHHYSPRVRQLVAQLSKNLNKIDYLEIEDFGKVNCKLQAQRKAKLVGESLTKRDNGEQMQFKLPVLYDIL